MHFSGVTWGRQEWKARHGNNLQGVQGEALALAIPEEIVEDLRHVVDHGPLTRIPKDKSRVTSKPHASYLQHPEEGMEKTWKELVHGRVLMLTTVAFGRHECSSWHGVSKMPMVRQSK